MSNIKLTMSNCRSQLSPASRVIVLSRHNCLLNVWLFTVWKSYSFPRSFWRWRHVMHCRRPGHTSCHLPTFIFCINTCITLSTKYYETQWQMNLHTLSFNHADPFNVSKSAGCRTSPCTSNVAPFDHCGVDHVRDAPSASISKNVTVKMTALVSLQHSDKQPHLSSVATLPCEIRNTVNVKLQQDLPQKWHQLHLNVSRVTCLTFTYFTVNSMLLTSSVTSLIVHLLQTSWDFEHDIIDAVIDRWHYRLRSRVHAGGGHFKHMHWNELSLMWFIRTFLILSMQFDAFNSYYVVNIKRWTCGVHKHFWCFKSHKVVWQH